ncbi:response regulator transcription factor [Lichenihabitans sp. Uapishka_5]|uniref:response regulator transcription factor n=1 Tax=Lichenihabitans sp. Uapishka_5 TaxID=3037302 RepID=UPI0029E7D27D|nr:response regulator transcription factor [Lichenihabitans sp. Uapishka_5]MDX7950266.1 response regulator transcription factor [Lichenihabitans sp. Uapishka_5]
MSAFAIAPDLTFGGNIRAGEGTQVLLDIAERRSLGVALIGPSSLFGEVLTAALAAAEPCARFSFHTSIDAWLTCPAWRHDRVLLLFLADDELTSPDKGNLARISRIKSLDPAPRFIICASHEHHSQVLRALEIGAEGYVVPTLSLKVLVQVIHLVNSGGIFVPASSLQHLSASAQTPVVATHASVNGLSPRQVLVAKALRKGTPNKVIAYELNMCESTVKVHVRHIMKKLHAKNRTQIAFLTNAMFAEGESM